MRTVGWPQASSVSPSVSWPPCAGARSVTLSV